VDDNGQADLAIDSDQVCGPPAHPFTLS